MTEEKILTKEIAQQFLEDEDSVDLEEFTSIEDAAAESLSRHKGELYLEGLTGVSNKVAESLSKHVGELDLTGLEEITDTAAESLCKHEGNLCLGGLASLSDTAAESLSKHQGSLRFGSFTSLSLVAAESLLKHSGELRVGLANLDEDVRELLIKRSPMNKWGRIEGPLINVECSYCGKTDTFELGEMNDSYETEYRCLESAGWGYGDKEDGSQYFACDACAAAAENIEGNE